MSSYFVTATGTDVGKTAVAASLLHAWHAKGVKARAFKPVVSGYDDAAPEGSDPYQLALAMGQEPSIPNLHAISPWHFKEALSPDMAALREGRTIPYDDVLNAARAHMADTATPLLVEGAGGIMVPLDNTHLLRDLMVDLGLPAILVAGTYLGTISHTLTALDSLATAGVPCPVIILSESVSSPVPPEETRDAILKYAPQVKIGILPRQPNENWPWETAPDLTDLLAD